MLCIKGFRRRYFIVLLVIIICLLFFFFNFLMPSFLDVNRIVQKAQDQLTETTSYCFDLSVRTVIDGEDRVVSIINGKFVQPNSYHLKGSSYDYTIDLYYIDNQLIFLDPVDKHWKNASSAPSLVTDAVLYTTSPIADFLTADDFQLLALKRINKRPVYRIKSILNDTTNPYWKIFFSNFFLESWIEYPNCQLMQLQLRGYNDDNSDKLIADLVFYNYNQPFLITLPDDYISD